MTSSVHYISAISVHFSSPILAVFLLWRVLIYQVDCNIFQNWWFHLEKRVYSRLYLSNPTKWIKKTFFGWNSGFVIVEDRLSLNQIRFRCILIQNPNLVSSDKPLYKRISFMSLEKEIVRRDAVHRSVSIAMESKPHIDWHIPSWLGDYLLFSWKC